MKQQRDGRLRSARASVASFPPAEEARGREGEAPSHADSSHIARRRASSAPAHEVDLDEVQLADEVDALDLQKTVKLSPPTSRRPMLIPLAVVLSALVGGGVAFFTRPEPTRATSTSTPTPTPTSTSTSTSTPTSTPTSTEANAHSDGIPVVDIATLPRPHTGVILGSPGHRLWIDGTLAPSWQTTVSCGPHTVQVGSAGAIRDVDVPCGTEINVQP